MTRLSVNINKIATIRNARGGSMPNVVKAAIKAQEYGAEGITVHPRPDERHIRYQDVRDLRPVVKEEFNIEGYPSVDFINLVLENKPEQVTLVPDPPDVLTSNAGWDIKEHLHFLKPIISDFKKEGIRCSLFVDTNLDNISRAIDTGCDRVELYTEPYALNYPLDRERAVAPFIKAAQKAHEVGLDINAGHDLNLDNLKFFKESLPFLSEVSIGHALISDALYLGLEKTIRKYLDCLI